ncbi:MAG: SLC13 family permease [Candidatus Anammoxibacter sp.]
MIATLILTITVLILFIGDWLPMEGISILIFVTLGISGILPGNKFLVGFSNPAPWMVASLFVVGAGFLHTGIVHSFGFWLLRLAGYSKKRFLLILMVVVLVISAFINNTAVVAVFLPLTILWSRQLNIAPSRLLMPISFCAILGGTCTLIGTSTNVVISGFSDILNFEPLGMFEMTGMGIIYAVAGLAYMFFVSIYLIPDRQAPVDNNIDNTKQKKYITEFQVTQESPFVEKNVADTPLNDTHGNYKIFNIIRGDEVFNPPLKNHIFKVNDLILVEIPTDHISLFKEKYMLSIKADHHLRPRDKGAEPVHLAEVMITPNSRLVGKTLAHLHFRLTHHVVVLAIQRRAKVLDQGFSSIRLKAGDILLLSGSTEAIDRLGNTRHVTLLSNRLEENQMRPKKAWAALTILTAFVLSASLTDIPIAAISLLAAATMVGLGCLSLVQAFQSLNWKIILFLGSSLSLGTALEETGAASLMAHYAMNFMQPFGDKGVILGIYLLTSFISSLVTNNAAAAIMIPFACGLGIQMGIDSRAIIMTVVFGASAAFATPIGYQTNMFIYGPGGYRFRDFLVIGIPLNLILAGMSVVLIPYFWPLR